MTIKTNPLRTGAPLDPDQYPGILSSTPRESEITGELIRAKVELMHAVALHRKAWGKMRAIRDELEEKAANTGIEAYPDNNTLYKLAVADVRWWREEMTAQAATVTALTSMMDGGRWPDSSVRGTTVFGWPVDGVTPPTQEQYLRAREWERDATRSGQRSEVEMIRGARRLIEVYERLNPQSGFPVR